MTNREITFFLRMRDEATKVFQEFKSKVTEGGQSIVENFKKNWLAITATVTGAFLAIRKAMDWVKLAADAQRAETAFRSIVERMGHNSKRVFEEINKASAGIIDESTVMALSTRAIKLGVPIERLGQLMLIARAQARDMGIGIQEAFESITEGIGRVNPRMLAQVGIVVKQRDLNLELSETLGKVSGGYSTAQQRIELMNEVLEKGSEALQRYNLEQKDMVEQLETIEAKFQELRETIGSVVMRIGIGIMGVFQAVQTFWTATYTVAFTVASQIEKLLNKLFGIKSKYFENLEKVARDKLKEISKETITSFELIFKGADENINKTAGAFNMLGDEVSGSTKPAIGSLAELRERARSLKEEMDKLNINTKSGAIAWENLNRKLQEVTVQIENIERKQKGLAPIEPFDFKIMIDRMNRVKTEVDKTSNEIKNIQKKYRFEVNEEESKAIDAQLELYQELKDKYQIILNEDYRERLRIINEWERQAIETSRGNEEMKTMIMRIASDERKRIMEDEARKTMETIETTANVFREVNDIMIGFARQRSDAIISNIEAEKEAKLGAIDAELKGQEISEARRAELLKMRESIEAEMNDKIRKEKVKMFQASKNAAIIEAIINTAVAVTKTLGQMGILGIPMAAIVTALGMAKVAMIASQPTPKFHSGGTAYYDAPPTSETFVKVRGGETIRVTTPEQESKVGKTVIVNINFNTPVPHGEWIKSSIEEGLRITGLTVDKFFVNKEKLQYEI